MPVYTDVKALVKELTNNGLDIHLVIPSLGLFSDVYTAERISDAVEPFDYCILVLAGDVKIGIENGEYVVIGKDRKTGRDSLGVEYHNILGNFGLVYHEWVDSSGATELVDVDLSEMLRRMK